jgi:hypothetical protein
VNTLKLVYDAFDEIRFHERNMDKELFQQFLVEGGGTMVSERDREGRHIVWTKRRKGTYNIHAGSPEESAYIRDDVRLSTGNVESVSTTGK